MLDLTITRSTEQRCDDFRKFRQLGQLSVTKVGFAWHLTKKKNGAPKGRNIERTFCGANSVGDAIELFDMWRRLTETAYPLQSPLVISFLKRKANNCGNIRVYPV
ncbi:hypothetical protein [Celeribacter halophilus]|uniref:hypothetical protein n=1 Tax=Celeribacter halophilus TaxID=576117 RepID=UPI001C093333|nr:hypothetical protein [Celeribacter halophilus]MDO6512283.1 hypothetical protein [Celeribacter halophilus]